MFFCFLSFQGSILVLVPMSDMLSSRSRSMEGKGTKWINWKWDALLIKRVKDLMDDRTMDQLNHWPSVLDMQRERDGQRKGTFWWHKQHKESDPMWPFLSLLPSLFPFPLVSLPCSPSFPPLFSYLAQITFLHFPAPPLLLWYHPSGRISRSRLCFLFIFFSSQCCPLPDYSYGPGLLSFHDVHVRRR